MKKIDEYFAGRFAALGTKHSKEIVIAPLFKKELGITIKVPDSLDTDEFGTFTLDRPRPNSQKETAVLKARAAMDILGLDIGIASEGTFGPHPQMPFGIANIEVVVFIDKKNGLKIFGGHFEAVSYAQNTTANNIEEVMDFAKRIDFPKHGIIIRSAEKKYKGMIKGIISYEQLESTAKEILSKSKSIWVETDFRAHVNSSRMKSISIATEDLIGNIMRMCPSCGTPGFHRISPKPGLPCESCARPTDLTLYDIYHCDKCEHNQEIIFPNDKTTAYAGYCDYCNP